jgi:hypothetical protein
MLLYVSISFWASVTHNLQERESRKEIPRRRMVLYPSDRVSSDQKKSGRRTVVGYSNKPNARQII